MELRADIDVDDNLQARRRRTRLAIFSRIGTFVIVFVTIGLMLLSIPGVRDIGVTLMASAGLAALAVGAAAQPALKSLIGGLQMALTEPIRIDDVVIIDGEWGRIEDIRTTYVVVRIWDERRLVVPVTKFLEETFQNWTRKGSELLGTVFLHLDPLAEVDRLRAEFERQVEANPLWDGRVKAVQVTETTLEFDRSAPADERAQRRGCFRPALPDSRGHAGLHPRKHARGDCRTAGCLRQRGAMGSGRSRDGHALSLFFAPASAGASSLRGASSCARCGRPFGLAVRLAQTVSRESFTGWRTASVAISDRQRANAQPAGAPQRSEGNSNEDERRGGAFGNQASASIRACSPPCLR